MTIYGLEAACFSFKIWLIWKRKKHRSNTRNIQRRPLGGGVVAQNLGASQPPLLSHNTRPPESVTNGDTHSAATKVRISVWPNICILGSPMYSNLGRMSKWNRNKFITTLDPSSLRICNQRLSSIIDSSVQYIGHFCDHDLSLNSKDHINMSRRQYECII